MENRRKLFIKNLLYRSTSAINFKSIAIKALKKSVNFIKNRSSGYQSIIELIGSMRFAISLLILIAVTSLIGSFIEQQEPYSRYINQFGPFWSNIFFTFEIFDIYNGFLFELIIGFLITSICICIFRNIRSIINNSNNWKDNLQEHNLESLAHHDTFHTSYKRNEVAVIIKRILKKHRYNFILKNQDSIKEKDNNGTVFIVAKNGRSKRIGYIAVHLAIVVVCMGNLIDSNINIRLQSWFFKKKPITDYSSTNELSAMHRLPSWNPSFRGYAWIKEGEKISNAILKQADGILIQDLPITIQLRKFIVDYYSTGLPKLFASDVLIINHTTGKIKSARIAVNKPVTFDGISIYQSSFEDGGTKLSLSLYPMYGTSSKAKQINTKIGDIYVLGNDKFIKFIEFHRINMEDTNSKISNNEMHKTLIQRLYEKIGFGIKSFMPLQSLHDIGPTLRFKIIDANGNSYELNNYTTPIELDGELLFLTGVRTSSNEPFRYMQIPTDSEGSLKEWMRLRAALSNKNLRIAAAKRFASRLNHANNATIRQLQQNALHILSLFAGDNIGMKENEMPGGFTSIAHFIDHTIPKNEQEKATHLLLKMLQGTVWDLWQIARKQDGKPMLRLDERGERFINTSLQALSDSFLYKSPVFIQLNNFEQIQTSVFQLTRTPGKKIVYSGSLLLIFGIFRMFYTQEKRLWFWIKDREGGIQVFIAMSFLRETIRSKTEFHELCTEIRAATSAFH